jgi:hypothetical protein
MGVYYYKNLVKNMSLKLNKGATTYRKSAYPKYKQINYNEIDLVSMKHLDLEGHNIKQEYW